MIIDIKKAVYTLLAVLCLSLISGCGAKSAPMPTVSAPLGTGIARASDERSKKIVVQTQTPADTRPVTYKNTDYGFNFTLPADWKGYSIVYGKWEGLGSGGKAGGNADTAGPVISIRNPGWTKQVPRQDIPIMIFTLDQWKRLQNDKFHVGASYDKPGELGRNHKYVFAIPAGYNRDFREGYRQVETILKSKPLKPTKAKK
ncbi:MAG: hypothetical protein GXY20_03865 [Clostridiales bacterium]|nr:hypothetical protein [Clostridiales bacterium]